ncbi:hypothetical protein D3C79_693290 [compost metagenome]
MASACSTSQVCCGVHRVLPRTTSKPPLIRVDSQRSWAPSKANDMNSSSRVDGPIS